MLFPPKLKAMPSVIGIWFFEFSVWSFLQEGLIINAMTAKSIKTTLNSLIHRLWRLVFGVWCLVFGVS